jgi:hypothetical protein
MFNALLEAAEIDPRDVRLVRHQNIGANDNATPYQLWRDRYGDFMAYQSRQSARTQKIIGRALFWASFVATPEGETLFVGLYGVLSKWPATRRAVGALTQDDIARDYVVYELQERDELSPLIARLAIDWGGASLASVQRAETNDKKIIELRRESKEEKSDGCLGFTKQLADIRTSGARSWG